MAAIAGIPVIGLVSEKLDIQAEETEETVEETAEETVEETTDIEEGGKYYEEDEDPTDDASAAAPEGGDEIPQEKIEGLVDAVLAAIEQETGVPAQRVDDAGEDEAEELEPEPEEEPPADDAGAEMMETSEPTLAERIAAAVQTVLDEDANLEEGSCTTNEEDEDKDDTNEETQLDEITQAVIARLLAKKSEG